MDAAAGSVREGANPPPAAQQEWRSHSNGAEENGDSGNSDEKAVFEGSSGDAIVDSWPSGIDGEDDPLQQQLRAVAQQREDLQTMEIELRAQAIFQVQIVAVQSGFDEKMKEQVDAATKLKEQLAEREKHILELEMNLSKKERELHDLKIANEAAWAKEEILREQNKELATFRRERDNTENERSSILNQIRDLQEHLHDKENQILALEEQNRVAQEKMIYKDEQLREAHAWISRVQDMDALQFTALQAELRDRIEQFTQYYLGYQRHYAEMEQHHLHIIHQLQVELAEARQQNRTSRDGLLLSNESSDTSGITNGNLAQVHNGEGNSFSKVDTACSVPVAPSTLLETNGFLPPGQMSGVHTYMMNPQGVTYPFLSTDLNSQLGILHSVSANSGNQNFSKLQAVSDASQSLSLQHAVNLDTADTHEIKREIQGSLPTSDHCERHLQLQNSVGAAAVELSSDVKVVEQNNRQPVVFGDKLSSNEVRDATRLNTYSSKIEQQREQAKVQDEKTIGSDQMQPLIFGQLDPSLKEIEYVTQSHNAGSKTSMQPDLNVHNSELHKSYACTFRPFQHSVRPDPAFLDERSLLACIVRAIPSGSDTGVSISTTLINRLGRMLTPLQWRDYEKFYGKLEEFVARHIELFVIEGDVIHLREGAHQIISATAAAAKFAATSVSSAPYGSRVSSVAVTPLAHNTRQKKQSIANSNSGSPIHSSNGSRASNFTEPFSSISQVQKASSGPSIVRGIANVTISSTKAGLTSQSAVLHSPLMAAVGNAGGRTLLPSEDKVVNNRRDNLNTGKVYGAGYTSRR